MYHFRAVYIPLMLAERAWSYAMQLRVEANTEPRKKFHLVSRLRKAASYALQLQKLCEVHYNHNLKTNNIVIILDSIIISV